MASIVKSRIRVGKAYYDKHEEEVQKFFRENDPLFLKKNKKILMSHPYLSAKQLRTRQSKEIQESCLGKKQRLACPKLCPRTEYVID